MGLEREDGLKGGKSFCKQIGLAVTLSSSTDVIKFECSNNFGHPTIYGFPLTAAYVYIGARRSRH